MKRLAFIHCQSGCYLLKIYHFFFFYFVIHQYLEKQPFLDIERWNSVTFWYLQKSLLAHRQDQDLCELQRSWAGRATHLLMARQEEPALQSLVDKSGLLFLAWGVREKILKREFPPPGKPLIPRISSSASLGNSQQTGATALSASSSWVFSSCLGSDPPSNLRQGLDCIRVSADSCVKFS